MLIQSRKQFDAAIGLMHQAELIAVDTETSGLEPYKGDYIAGISVYFELDIEKLGLCNFSYYFPFRHAPGQTLLDQSESIPVSWMRDLAAPLGRTDCEFVFHNAKYDMAMLEKERIHINGHFYDTLIMSHMDNENVSHKLENLVDSLFGWNTLPLSKEIKKLADKLGGYHKIPPKTIEPYACQDVKSAYYLHEHYIEQLQRQDLWHLWPQEEEYNQCLRSIERTGIKINTELAKEMSDKCKARMRIIEDELGFDPMKREQLARKLFMEAPEGLGFVPGPLTKDKTKDFPKGIPVLDEESLLRYQHEVIDRVLEYRGLVKANSTWFEGFLEKIDANDRLHPTFNQAGTRTTRLSASNPNMQQLPRDPATAVRKLLIPDNGYRLYEHDYNQIELRLAATYANEEVMIKAFIDGTDIHQLTADTLGLTRYQGKTLNFAILYGAGPERVASLLDVSFSDAKDIISNFFENFVGFKKIIDKATEAAKARGFVKLWTGRRRHFAEVYETHKAFNAIIQGGAAEIVKETMLRFYRQPDEKMYRMVGQVHDSILFEINENAHQELAETLKSIMEWPIEMPEILIPFPVEAKLLV